MFDILLFMMIENPPLRDGPSILQEYFPNWVAPPPPPKRKIQCPALINEPRTYMIYLHIHEYSDMSPK